MLHLPNEILGSIARQLSFNSFNSFSNTCKEIQNALYDITAERKAKIPWKIVIHLINRRNEWGIDQAWVVLGSSGMPLQDLYGKCEQYCMKCDDADTTYCNGTIMHGDDEIEPENIYTVFRTGVGTDMLNNILANTYNEDGNILVPLTVYIRFYDYMNLSDRMTIKIGYNDITKNAQYFAAQLIINDLDENDYSTSEIVKYGLHGLYVDPYESKSPYSYREDSSEDLGDYDLSQYNTI